MNHVHMLDQWLNIARRLGYQVRYDYFGGTGGGACQYGAKKYLFIDLALSPQEQLEQLVRTLKRDPLLETVELSQPSVGATRDSHAA